jgi:hypothetical protein
MSACSAATAQGNQHWMSLSQANLPGLRAQLQQKYSSDAFSIDAGRMRVLKVKSPNQAQPLYLVDTRVAPERKSLNPTCGAAGCAFEGYIQTRQTYREVLSVYLNPDLPKETLLVEPASAQQNGFPCLNFNQPQKQTGKLEVIQWCYDGQRYQFVNSTLHQ